MQVTTYNYDSTSESPVFLVSLADNCHYCQLPFLDELRTHIGRSCRYVQTNMERMSVFSLPLPDILPRNISDIYKWYPMFIIVKGKAWNQRHLGSGDVHIFNGEINGNGVVSHVTGMASSRDLDSILAWFDNVMNVTGWNSRKMDPAMIAEIIEISPMIALSPMWARSESGLFQPAEGKTLTSCGKRYLDELLNTPSRWECQCKEMDVPNTKFLLFYCRLMYSRYIIA